MHAILVTLGTDGDVYPYLGLGELLRRRGHRVTLATNEPFAEAAARRDLEFRVLVPTQELDELYANPDFWRPLRSGALLARWGGRQLRRHYEIVESLLGDDALLIANTGALAARIAHDKHGTPLISLVLQPGVIPSALAPPVMPGGLSLPRWAPLPVGKLYWRGLDLVGGWLVCGKLNRYRAELGLLPVRRLFQWWNSPQQVIALFPDWYGPKQPDWPPQFETTAFPRPTLGELPAEVATFCRVGEPPIVFTFGTGMLHAEAQFRFAIEACLALGRRGILLTKYPDQLPGGLPETIRHFPFAPFAALFPECAAVVHHGGVGTTAAALAAGTPQVVLPFAFDQEDNGDRVTRLGVGECVKPRRISAKTLTAALRKVLSPEVADRCRALAPRCSGDGLEMAADLVEAFAARMGCPLRGQNL